MTSRRPLEPVRVAVVNDYQVIVEGVAAVLSRHPERVAVAQQILVGESLDERVDVALYDTYGRIAVADESLATLVGSPAVSAVCVFTLDLRPDLVASAIDAGARAVISKALDADQLVDALVRVADGEEVGVVGPVRGRAAVPWPGGDEGLTERESQVLVLCAEGLTNREIADALYIGVETVKSHLKRIYRCLGLRNRTQAASYVERSGTFRRYRPAAEAGLRRTS